MVSCTSVSQDSALHDMGGYQVMLRLELQVLAKHVDSFSICFPDTRIVTVW